MQEEKLKTEILPYKKTIKLSPALGDWTTYKPLKSNIRKIRSGLYGFGRLSKEELEAALLIHYLFADKLSNKLKSDLGIAADLYSISAEQLSCFSFFKSINKPVLHTTLSIEKGFDPALLIFDLGIASTIISHTMGYKNAKKTAPKKFDAAENLVIKKALDKYLKDFNSAFLNTLSDHDLAIVSSPTVTIDASMKPMATMIVFSIELALNDEEPSKIFFSYSAPLLRKIIQKYKEKKNSNPLDINKFPPEILETLPVSIEVSLGQTSIAADDLKQLEKGDVIVFDNKLAQLIPIKITASTTIFCQPGTKDKNTAAKIISMDQKKSRTIQSPKTKQETAPLEEPQEKEYPVSEERTEEPTETSNMDGAMADALEASQIEQQDQQPGIQEEESKTEEFNDEDIAPPPIF